jgi:hypothetical protein
MTKLSWLGLLTCLLLFTAPAAAQDDPMPAGWQAVITGQVEAFRSHDAPGAFQYAAASFHQSFASPEDFVRAIREWGYEAIMDSRTHSFGPYEWVGENVVLQFVRFTGRDSALYEAIYQLNREADGWRVGGVQLRKTAGMGA